MRGGRGSTGGGARATSSGSSSWRPRLVHVRGFAPFGTGHRINKLEAKTIQESIMSILDEADKMKLSPLHPFVQNHQVTFNTRGCNYEELSMLFDHINLAIAKHKALYKGHDLRATMEVSPGGSGRSRRSTTPGTLSPPSRRTPIGRRAGARCASTACPRTRSSATGSASWASGNGTMRP